MCEILTVSERRACRVLGQVRRTQRYASILSDDEAVLVAHVLSLATEYGRYGYRRITALLRADGWPVNHKVGGADLAAGRVESASPSAQTWTAVV